MKPSDGFEGNAQSLRIVGRLARRDDALDIASILDGPSGEAARAAETRNGLNLTSRVLAAILKYDHEMNFDKIGHDEFQKGYYKSEADIVMRIKRDVLGIEYTGQIKTIECQIMDIADDIAYSTFDLEDAFSGGFLSPLALLFEEDRFYNEVSDDIRRKNDKDVNFSKLTGDDVRRNVVELFEGIFLLSAEADVTKKSEVTGSDGRDDDGTLARLFVVSGDTRTEVVPQKFLFGMTKRAVKVSQLFASDGNFRSELTSHLVKEGIKAVEIDGEPNYKYPALTKIRLNRAVKERIECLKRLVYRKVIMAPRVQQSRHGGREIVSGLFRVLSDRESWLYFPSDYRADLEACRSESMRKRIICDYIAGMTDSFAAKTYSRLLTISGVESVSGIT